MYCTMFACLAKECCSFGLFVAAQAAVLEDTANQLVQAEVHQATQQRGLETQQKILETERTTEEKLLKEVVGK